MTDLTPRHCKTCTCTIGAVPHAPTHAAAGVPSIAIVDFTAGAQPFVVAVPLAGAAGAPAPMTFERITVRT